VQEKLQPEPKTAAQLIVSSNSNEWYTPDKYIQSARKVMDCINIDPATSLQANKTVQAEVIYTAEDSGLQHDWHGRVWLNPPYGNLTEAFVTKLIAQYRAGITTEAILLVNSHATDTKWFQPLWDYLLCFTDHRINFYSPGSLGVGSTHGSVFIYFGDNQDGFAKEFSEYGNIVRRYSL
jgi:phage N-6-adenine-methyltransferase